MKIGLGQLLVEGGEAERNIERAEKLIKEASEKNCDLIILPETLDLAWTHPSALNEAEPIPGLRSKQFEAFAQQYNIWICLGLTERDGDHRYNTALLISKTGELIHKYRKINLLEVEFPYYTPGQQIGVVDTEFGKIGINICADNYQYSTCIGHTLARMGAQIILSPSSWTVDHSITEEEDPYQDKWIKPLKELATLYEIPVISTTSVGYIVGGPYEGKKMVGCSLAINSNGEINQGEFNEFASHLSVVEVRLGEGKYKGTQFEDLLIKKAYFR